jgi:hypothetical protein
VIQERAGTRAGFEEWFRALGRPAASFDLPERGLPPTEDELRRMIALSKSLQVEMIRPVEF